MSRVVAEYIYTDAKNRPRLRKVRYEPRDFRTHSCLGVVDGKPTWGRRVLPSDETSYLTTMYLLPDLLAALKAGEPVVWCEGEKDTHAAIDAWGITSTTTALSASGTLVNHAEWFGRYGSRSRVYVIADNDPAGAFSAWERLTMLRYLDPAPEVDVLAPPWDERRLNDTHDAVEAGLSLCDMRRVRLSPLRAAAERYRGSRAARSGYTKRARS